MEEHANFATKEEIENSCVVILETKKKSPSSEKCDILTRMQATIRGGYKHIFSNIAEIANNHVQFDDVFPKVHVEGRGNSHLKDVTQKEPRDYCSAMLSRHEKTNVINMSCKSAWSVV